jgi:hypothetical protein
VHFIGVGLSGAGGEELVRIYSLQLDGVRE